MGGKRGGETWREFGTGKEKMGLENRKKTNGSEKDREEGKQETRREGPTLFFTIFAFIQKGRANENSRRPERERKLKVGLR